VVVAGDRAPWYPPFCQHTSLARRRPGCATLRPVAEAAGGRDRRRRMAVTWDTAKSKAIKILGKDAKIPEPKAIGKLGGDLNAAWDAYHKSRDDLEDKVLDLQKMSASLKLTLQQFADKIDDEDFGLDEKNKEDAKKIKEAQSMFDDWSKYLIDVADSNIDNLEELDKHLVNIKKYKQKQA
jgi:hypothetical protein